MELEDKFQAVIVAQQVKLLPETPAIHMGAVQILAAPLLIQSLVMCLEKQQNVT